MAVEQFEVVAWLYTTLSGDATITTDAPGGVWPNEAPPSVSTPYVVIGHQGGHDVMGVNSARLMVDDLYRVSVSAPVTATVTVQAVADRIDALLQRKSGTQGGVSVMHCRREQVQIVPENVAGQDWTTARLLFRVWAQ